MTDDKKQKLQARMAALHDKYCNQLPDKYQEIEDNWVKYRSDLSNPELIDTFYRLIHTLKGTAATFGFVKQANICFEVQKLLLEAKENHSALIQSSTVQIQQHLDQLKANINTPAEDVSD